MVRTWNPSTGKCLSTLKGHQKAVYSVGWSLIGTLASGSEDGTIKIWDLPTESCSLTLSEGNEGVHSIAWSPDGSLLCSGSRKGFLRIWDISTKTLTRTLKGHTEGVSSLSWGQDGRLASLGESIIRVWNPISGECNVSLLYQGVVRFGLSRGLEMDKLEQLLTATWFLCGPHTQSFVMQVLKGTSIMVHQYLGPQMDFLPLDH